MKKNIILVCLLTLVLMVAGCTQNEDNGKDITESVTHNDLENTTANDSKDEIEVSDENVPLLQEEVEYNLVVVEYVKTENHDINYPEISGWKNEEMQTKWNGYFVETATSMLDDVSENDGISYKVDSIYTSPNILSIVMKGYMYYEGSAHPYSFISTCNIDMKTGEKAMLKDFADLDKIADILLNTTDYTVLTEGVTLDDILQYNFMNIEPTQELLTRNLSHFDGEQDIYEADECYGTSYLDGETVYLVFEVPHALGDFVIVRIDDNLSQNLIDISSTR